MQTQINSAQLKRNPFLMSHVRNNCFVTGITLRILHISFNHHLLFIDDEM